MKMFYEEDMAMSIAQIYNERYPLLQVWVRVRGMGKG